MLSEKTYLLITGIFFVVTAIGQTTRLIFKVPVKIGEFNAPMWPTVIILIFSIGLGISAFRLLIKK